MEATPQRARKPEFMALAIIILLVALSGYILPMRPITSLIAVIWGHNTWWRMAKHNDRSGLLILIGGLLVGYTNLIFTFILILALIGAN